MGGLVVAFSLAWAMGGCTSRGSAGAASKGADSASTGRLAALNPCSATSKLGEMCRLRLQDARPTQMGVGLRAARERSAPARKVRGDASSLDAWLEENPQAVVIGPGGISCLTGPHALARGLLDAELSETYGSVAANFSDVTDDSFLALLEERSWVQLMALDGSGPRAFADLPPTLAALPDDPWRSLADELQAAGAHEGGSTPAVEARWADFLRARLPASEAEDFGNALKRARELAQSSDASGLPGYLRP
jgi:hypothetical protein